MALQTLLSNRPPETSSSCSSLMISGVTGVISLLIVSDRLVKIGLRVGVRWLGSGEDVHGRLQNGVANVVVEQAARNFFQLLVADDFRSDRSDFVAHSK